MENKPDYIVHGTLEAFDAIVKNKQFFSDWLDFHNFSGKIEFRVEPEIYMLVSLDGDHSTSNAITIEEYR